MPQKLLKVIFSLVLTIIFIMACFAAFIIFSFASWLHTYKSFTQRRLVAVIEVQPSKTDQSGFEYTNVTYRPVKEESALISVLNPGNSDEEELGNTQEYKLYGDHFEVGGEIVKFKDFWNLFNLRNIYKVTRLEGDYTDASTAKSLPSEKRSVIELNGGTDDYWKRLQRNTQDYGFLIDTVYGSYATKFTQDETQKYGLYITEDGFLLDLLDD